MKPSRYRPTTQPSRLERQARRVAIAVAVALLGITAIEMAVVTKRHATIQKSPPAIAVDHSQ
jgi:hypothetical protein